MLFFGPIKGFGLLASKHGFFDPPRLNRFVHDLEEPRVFRIFPIIGQFRPLQVVCTNVSTAFLRVIIEGVSHVCEGGRELAVLENHLHKAAGESEAVSQSHLVFFDLVRKVFAETFTLDRVGQTPTHCATHCSYRDIYEPTPV